MSRLLSFPALCSSIFLELPVVTLLTMPRSRLALKVEGLARVSKNAGGRPRLASVAFDGRYMGLAL